MFDYASKIDDTTVGKVKKLRDELGLMRFRPMPPKKQVGQQQKWIWPVESRIVTSFYGYRIHPIFKERIFHDGIDISESNNKPVWAVADGKVIMAKWNGGYGKYIAIDHGNGIISFYGHLNSHNVKAGDYVKQGQEIGKVGSTGYSTGNHLHFGVRKNKQSVNPLDFLPKVR